MNRKLDILFEDNHLIVVNKQPGQLVQGDITGDVSLDLLLKQYIKKKYNKPGDVFLGVVHRIDRPASGVVVFARTSKALSRMNELFREKQVQKTYWAIVREMPNPEEGRLKHFLLRKESKNRSFAYDKSKSGTKEAILDYALIFRVAKYSLLEIQLHTGRHHQIRCQLAKIGSPIKGDLKYGYPQSNNDGNISLHARSIEFIHPVQKQPILIKAPVPVDPLWKSLSQDLD
jgi:23S rRNA pseudouridine1911/1915/1917 synthase